MLTDLMSLDNCSKRHYVNEHEDTASVYGQVDLRFLDNEGELNDLDEDNGMSLLDDGKSINSSYMKPPSWRTRGVYQYTQYDEVEDDEASDFEPDIIDVVDSTSLMTLSYINACIKFDEPIEFLETVTLDVDKSVKHSKLRFTDTHQLVICPMETLPVTSIHDVETTSLKPCLKRKLSPHFEQEIKLARKASRISAADFLIDLDGAQRLRLSMSSKREAREKRIQQMNDYEVRSLQDLPLDIGT